MLLLSEAVKAVARGPASYVNERHPANAKLVVPGLSASDASVGHVLDVDVAMRAMPEEKYEAVVWCAHIQDVAEAAAELPARAPTKETRQLPARSYPHHFR